MRRRACMAGIVLYAFGFFGMVHPALAQDPGAPGDQPYPVELLVGQTFNVCLSGQIVCPGRVPICDDPNVVVPVDTPDGLGFKGVAPGSTLCSAASSAGPRRIFRFSVR